MARYEVTAPDGSRHEVTTPEGGTEADAIDYLRSTYKPAERPMSERLWEGIKGGASRMRDELLPPGNPLTLFDRDQAAAGQQVRDRKADLARYEATKGELGTAGAIGDVLPEIALTAAPIARGGTAVSKFPLAMKALGRFAPAAGDIAANAGYSAGKAAYNGEDVGDAALYGAGGAAAGRAVSKVAGKVIGGVANRLTSGMSPEARLLLESGVTTTPGQAFPGGVVSRLEDLATGFPGAGPAVNAARARSLGQYTTAEIDRALAPLGIDAKALGGRTVEDTVARARAAVSQTFEEVAPRTFIDPATALHRIHEAVGEIKKIPLLTEQQQRALAGYMDQKILPTVTEALHSGTTIPGRVAKDLDIELGSLSRKYEASTNPSDGPMASAFRAMQASLRNALEGVDPEARALLGSANAAHRNMLPVIDAATKAAGKMGQFSPIQFNKAAGKFGQDAGELNAAARQTLGSNDGLASTLTRRGIGIGGFAYDPLTAVATYAGGAALGRVLYSEAGVKTMLGAMKLLPHIRQWVEGLPPEKQREFIIRMAKEVPSLHQLAAQVGRQIATQPAEEVTP